MKKAGIKHIIYTIVTVLFFGLTLPIYSQDKEYVPISNPVYKFLERAETRGFLPYFSLSDLPLQRYEVIEALRKIDEHKENLSNSEMRILEKYAKEFFPEKQSFAAIFPTENDEFFFSMAIISDAEKVAYNFRNDKHSVSVEPVLLSDFMMSSTDNEHFFMQHVGGRIHGTLGKYLGYSLQATNGFFLSGNKSLAMHDTKYRQNIKFVALDSDLDYSHSHVIFSKDWFFASLEREERLMGAGMNTNVFVSNAASPYDALNLGVKFKRFSYKFTHAGLIGYVDSTGFYQDTGFGVVIPSKYITMHRLALRFAKAEFSLWEGIIYSDRAVDFAYINPLSFLKSVEHSLRDRDNSLMGADMTLRPFKNISIKAGFLLDDLKFDEIGTDYWSNKTAWNVALLAAPFSNFDFGVEYSKVDPFTYSHFNNQNSYTNDSMAIGNTLLPNSDRMEFRTNWWLGGRYPLTFTLSRTRHGENIFDESGNPVKNVGGDINLGHAEVPSTEAPFLDGTRNDVTSAEVSGGFEISRGMVIGAAYKYNFYTSRDLAEHVFRVTFILNEF
jgi:hypothetical protein